MWTHRTLSDASQMEAEPPRLAPALAQAWCNFVLWTPADASPAAGGLPAGASLAEGSLRREAPPGRPGGHATGRAPWSESNPAAYRFEVGGGGRRLRVKEFLYDWAFPALDHPCLWRSATHARRIDAGHVLWCGVDYMGHAAASARMARTTIELSVLAGAFGEDEMLALYRCLRPVDPAAAAEIAATPLAALSYWARRPDATPVEVPVGLWAIPQPRSAVLRWHTGHGAAAGLPAALAGLPLDSSAEEVAGGGPVRVEAVYAGGPERGHELRLHVHRGREGTLPPEREPHPGQTAVLALGDGTWRADLAWIDERYGPFDAILSRGPRRLRLLSSTGVGLDRAWFLAAATEVARAWS